MGQKPELPSEIIISSLDHILSSKSNETILNGAFLSTVDAFDRKINREPFIHLTNSVVDLHNHVGRLEILDTIVKAYEEDRMSKERVEEARKRIFAKAEALRQKVLKEARLVVQCPDPDDTLN